MPDWKDKSVLVTGASSGLGKIIAAEFAKRGANVAITARDRERLEAAAEQIRGEAAGGGQEVVAIAGDVTSDEDVQRTIEDVVERFGRLDVLVNNAGRSDRGEALATSVDDFRQLLEVNFLATVRCTQMAAPHLLESKGHVVNIGSLGAKTVSPFLGAYPASKFPVAAYSHQLRLELGPQGLHVLLVCPGPIALPEVNARYEEMAAQKHLPVSAGKPGGGVHLKGINAEKLAGRIIRACQRRQAELIVPSRARWLFAVSALSPTLGDWIIRKMTSR